MTHWINLRIVVTDSFVKPMLLQRKALTETGHLRENRLWTNYSPGKKKGENDFGGLFLILLLIEYIIYFSSSNK